MTRVSLKEAYDNKDVVAQIYAIRDIAQSAEDTADSAVTTANDAKTYVDTLGVQVEGAVQTANNASASAQASAETVSQYDQRLGDVEDLTTTLDNDLGRTERELDAVTLRVTTAEGNIVTIQGRVTALETADGQNVKINNINAYAVGLTGNQTPIAGNKEWVGMQTFNVGGTFARPVTVKNPGMNVSSTDAVGRSWIWITDQNGDPVWILSFNQEGARRYVALRTYKADGTYAQTVLADVTA